MNTRSMSTCQTQISAEESADVLYNFLKTAGDGTTLETNRMVPGLAPDTYGNPPARKEREETADALWGQEDLGDDDRSGTAVHHSNSVWDGFRAGRERFLERNFDSFDASKAQALAELSAGFDHFKSGDHESSKPFTNEHSKRVPVVVESVLDKTKRVLGI